MKIYGDGTLTGNLLIPVSVPSIPALVKGL